jgi:hypothetical protein
MSAHVPRLLAHLIRVLSSSSSSYVGTFLIASHERRGYCCTEPRRSASCASCYRQWFRRQMLHVQHERRLRLLGLVQLGLLLFLFFVSCLSTVSSPPLIDAWHRDTPTRHGKASLVQAIDGECLEGVLVAFQPTHVLELSVMSSGCFQCPCNTAESLQQTE